MSSPRLGIQLIIFRDRPRQDLAGVLRDVARAGYDGVEAGNLFRGADPAAIQALFAETGLSLTGAHAGYGEFTDLAKVDEDIQFLKAMGDRSSRQGAPVHRTGRRQRRPARRRPRGAAGSARVARLRAGYLERA